MRESSGIASGLSGNPAGGGGIGSLGDRFQPDLVKGTGNYSVPIDLPKGPNEIAPKVSLTYSTGAGNGPFGMGWQLEPLKIERRSDRGIPEYNTGDSFVFGSGVVLINTGGNKYRPKTDNIFWTIEFENNAWTIFTGDGRKLMFGQSDASREGSVKGTFAWYLDSIIDQAGNEINYSYMSDGDRLYLSSIDYSIFSLKIIYEDRPDVLRNGRAGFLRTTSLRAKSLQVHCSRLTPALMRSYELKYEEALNKISLLSNILLTATLDGETAQFPEISFHYSNIDLNNFDVDDIKSFIAPPSLDEASTQLVDLNGDGLPDILQTSTSRTYLWTNNGTGEFEGPISLKDIPSVLDLSRKNVAFADLDGNGRVDLFSADQPLQMMFSNSGKGNFEDEPVIFRNTANIRLTNPENRLTDIDGDGVIDLFETGRDFFLLYKHEKFIGWDDPIAVGRKHDMETFPDLMLGRRGIFLDNIKGDGLEDLLWLKSGQAVYWPYLGNGEWSDAVEMLNPPVFPQGYRDEKIILCDVDGDGCTDVVYFDFDKTMIWINNAGNNFSGPFEIPVSPQGDMKVVAADFFGDGRPGFLWTGSPLSYDSSGYRFLRLDNGKKPYLLSQIENGMGGVYEMDYSTSSHLKAKDFSEGREWKFQLPFPVQVVTRIRNIDTINNRVIEQRINYHDGVFDGPDREFRGFTNVEFETLGDESLPGTRQELTFFHGDPDLADLVERDKQKLLSGSLLSLKMYEILPNSESLREESIQDWDTMLLESSIGGDIFFPFLKQIKTTEHSITGQSSRIEIVQYNDFDQFGNVGGRIRQSFFEGQAEEDRIVTEERFNYINDPGKRLIKLLSRSEVYDGSGLPLASTIRYYDGDDFIGLPEGQADKGLTTRVVELKMLPSRMPDGYADGRNFDELGYISIPVNGEEGLFAATMSVARDGKGNVIMQKDALENVVSIEYDDDDVYPVSGTDVAGNITTFIYNPRCGEPELTLFSDGRSIRNEYDPIGRLKATFERNDDGDEELVKCWLTDIQNLPASVTSFAPKTAGRTPDEFRNNPNPESLNDVSICKAFYSGLGTQIGHTATGPLKKNGDKQFVISERVKLNPKGAVSVKFPAQFVDDLEFVFADEDLPGIIRFFYDYKGTNVETFGPGDSHFKVIKDNSIVSLYEGDSSGEPGLEKIPSGDPVRIENYDAKGRLILLNEMDGNNITSSNAYEISADGLLKKVKNFQGNDLVTYNFAGPDNPVQITHRDVGSRIYYRDAGNRLIERINPDGSSLQFKYDEFGRMTKIERKLAGGVQSEIVRELIYDSDPDESSAGRFLPGRLAVVREGNNVVRYSYTRKGKVVEETVIAENNRFSNKWDFNLQGEVTAVTYPDGRKVNYVREDCGGVKEVEGVAADFVYDEEGSLLSYVLNNGMKVKMERDEETNRMKNISAVLNNTMFRSLDYQYDTVGNITVIKDQMNGAATEWHEYNYDTLHRITEDVSNFQNPGGGVIHTSNYQYDPEGNITLFNDLQTKTMQYSDPVRKGRLTGLTQGNAVESIQYDGNGNIISAGELQTIVYDAFDRMTSTVITSKTLNITYDHNGRRVLKRVNNNGLIKTTFYAAGLYERNQNNSIRHIFLDKFILCSETENIATHNVSTAYYLGDHHGTILLASDANGNVIANQRYSPFGSVINNSAILDKYLGRDRDSETELLQLGARYYASFIGRFITPDWYVLENPDRTVNIPQALNVYSYSVNNPLVFKDPSGMFIFLVAGLIMAILYVAAIATVVAFAVGFIAGLVYGLSTGMGWESILRGLEAGLTTVVGMWLGAITGMLVGSLFGPQGMLIGGITGGIIGGLNGAISGMTGIYNWASWKGWASFLSDSTWSLPGTALGLIVHAVNIGWGDYQANLSERQNRHVYKSGVRMKNSFTFTLGNVISNAGQGGSTIDLSFIANHEELHIWQARIFGPLYELTYIVWAAGALIVSFVYWAGTGFDKNFGTLLETTAYYDNPFEYWAYNNDSNWPPSGSGSDLRWD